MYARNKPCTVCGTKMLFKQNYFFSSKPSSVVLITFGCQFKYPERVYPENKIHFCNILEVS